MDRSVGGEDLGFALDRVGDVVADSDSKGCGAGAGAFCPVTTLIARFSALLLFGPIYAKSILDCQPTLIVSWLFGTYLYIHPGIPFTRNFLLQYIVDNKVNQ